MVTKTSGEKSNAPVSRKPAEDRLPARDNFRLLQRALGNQAFGRMLNPPAPPGSREHRDTSPRQAPTPPPWPIQPRLRIGPAGDSFEREAAAVAERVMRMAGPGAVAGPSLSSDLPGFQRKCSCGGSCDTCQAEQEHEPERLQMKREGSGDSDQTTAPPIVHEVLRSTGRSLDAAARAVMEHRFGRDFSRVRVHTDARAAQSARAVGAVAYTVQNHIVFADGRYAPSTADGGKLLAHELTHAVQQGAAGANPISGTGVEAVHTGAQATVARFSDTVHHVVEEAALAGAGFDTPQIEAIEKGNIHRDYSQVYTALGGGTLGKAGNFLLLCTASDFGGYRQQEHFDNYMWDAVQGGWRSRGGSALGEQGIDVKQTPIDYIVSEFEKLVNAGVTHTKESPQRKPQPITLTPAGLEHLGNAFHTIEDFFAHSNFVELMLGERIYGDTLITADPVGPSESVDRIFEAISPPAGARAAGKKAEEKKAAAAFGTHTRMSHDDPTTHNFVQARRIAALVIQDLGRDILAIMGSSATRDQTNLMQKNLEAKVRRYLRPPDRADKWWERLTAADKGQIDTRLDEASRRTLTEENQCMISPLKNLEVSKNSRMVLPIGLTLTGRQFEEGLARLKIRVPEPNIHSWLFDRTAIQIGAGILQPFPQETVADDTVMRALSTSLYELFPIGKGDRPALVFGAQFTKRF